MKKDYFIMIDTETVNGYEKDGRLELRDSLVYDIGWQVVDRQGRVYSAQSFIIEDIFIDEKELMRTAYYADKLPQYWADYYAKKRNMVNILTARAALRFDFLKWNCKAIIAHNAQFDVRALNNTLRYVTKSQKRYFLPYEAEVWDTLKMARDTVYKQKKYIDFCEKNNYLTKHKTPRPRLTAEILYRFISGENDFIEKHTGLEDVQIETQIFAYILKKFHRPIDKILYKSHKEIDK